ncbi:MAG: hypothetical protein MUO21_07875 [Nitrososphaeraceae archaeon]|nr:hypothetical protein [Nitrososphaeraceae archaeon]
MQTEKIDLCIVTRDGTLPKGIEFIPFNKLIISDIKPVGKARQDCIRQVTTPIFSFIDSDMIIDEYWYDVLNSIVKRDNIGAVCGMTLNKGLGFFDKFTGDLRTKDELRDRLNTNNCLIKTELVKDCIPTIGLNCYEDLDLGNHIMGKGKDIIFIPSTAIHHKGWAEWKKSALWAGYRFIEAHDRAKRGYYLGRIIRFFKTIVFRGIPFSIFMAYKDFWFTVGMIKRDLGMSE